MGNSLIQTQLNAHLNDALAAFVADCEIDFETAMNAIEDLKADAPSVLKQAGVEPNQ